jgi:DNA-binding transcriptional regulator YhcF (GntR family)
MTNNGWVKVYRKLEDNPIARKPCYCHLWVTLLLKAAHQEREFIWNGQKRILKPGELLTGRDELSADSGIAPSTVERILNYLENEHQIEQHKTNRFRLITIKNWERYQNSEQQNEQPVDNQRTTEHQKADTYKNDNKKKDDNDKNKNKRPKRTFSSDSVEYRLSQLLLELILSRKPDCKQPDIQLWAKHIDRMIKLDNRTPERIEAVIRWCQNDAGNSNGWAGWQNNILSTETLRAKFDKLELSMEKKGNGTTTANRQHNRQFASSPDALAI